MFQYLKNQFFTFFKSDRIYPEPINNNDFEQKKQIHSQTQARLLKKLKKNPLTKSYHKFYTYAYQLFINNKYANENAFYAQHSLQDFLKQQKQMKPIHWDESMALLAEIYDNKSLLKCIYLNTPIQMEFQWTVDSPVTLTLAPEDVLLLSIRFQLLDNLDKTSAFSEELRAEYTPAQLIAMTNRDFATLLDQLKVALNEYKENLELEKMNPDPLSIISSFMPIEQSIDSKNTTPSTIPSNSNSPTNSSSGGKIPGHN